MASTPAADVVAHQFLARTNRVRISLGLLPSSRVSGLGRDLTVRGCSIARIIPSCQDPELGDDRIHQLDAPQHSEIETEAIE